MKVSNLTVNLAMRSRRSSNPKLIEGRESAIEGAWTEERGGCMMLEESVESKSVAMLSNSLFSRMNRKVFVFA